MAQASLLKKIVQRLMVPVPTADQLGPLYVRGLFFGLINVIGIESKALF